MWVDVLTKPLQGAKFRLMQAFLMNCPIDYSEDHIINSIPTQTPSLSKHDLPSSHKRIQPFVPSDNLSDIPMMKRPLRPTPSSRGCVETKSHGTKVPSTSRTYEYAPKHVTWKATSPAEFGYSPRTSK